jgi:hypothetical protein
MRRHSPVLFLALAVPALSGCIAAAGGAAGALVTHELLTNSPHIAHVRLDVDEVWPATVEALRDMGATDLEVQNYPRVVKASVYDGELVLKVEAFDLDHTVVKLQFRKNGLVDSPNGERVLEEVIKRYDYQRS